jgi:hypothetical protein
MEKESPYMIRRSFELLISENVQSVAEILSTLPFPPNDLEEIADLSPETLTGSAESRAEPVLQQEFRGEASNVVRIFSGKGD